MEPETVKNNGTYWWAVVHSVELLELVLSITESKTNEEGVRALALALLDARKTFAGAGEV